MSITDANQEQRVSIRANGPYVVSGSVPLVRTTPIVTDQGEPVGWERGPVVDDGVAYALCRCGGSSNKPYCDGTHSSNGFDGSETASGTYAERSKELGGTGITVRDDRSICEHAGFCGNKVTNVWKMVADTGDDAVRAEVIAMIERCPSGALTYETEPELRREIGIVPDGPLFLSGGIPIDPSGDNPIETRNRVTLCRCGGSKNKPLCDGTHADIGFTG